MRLAGGFVVVAGQGRADALGPLGAHSGELLQAAPQGRSDEADGVLGEHRVGDAGRVDGPAVADHTGLLGDPEELRVEELHHPGPQQPGPELGQARVGDAPVVERQAERRLPRQVQAAAPLRLPVRQPVEELPKQQRGEHRRRVRWTTTPGGVERLEVLVPEQHAPCPPQRGQEPLVVEEVVTQHVGVPHQALILGIASHEASLRDQFTSTVDFRPPN